MTRILSVILLLVVFCTAGSSQDMAGTMNGSGEYLPGQLISDQMKQMSAEKKLMLEIASNGSVAGKLTTTFKRKASIPHEGGDQNFILTGKYESERKKLLLVITHFRSKPDFSESYLTFMKPDSVYYDVSESKQGDAIVITGIANPALNTNANAEWVGSFRGGGLSMDVSGNNSLHILPLRIRFDIEGKKEPTPISSVTSAVYVGMPEVAPVKEPAPEAMMARPTKIQKIITLDTGFIKLELYDNGEIDGDTATLIFDGKTILNKQRLSATAAVVTLTVPSLATEHVLELYANNLGNIPPNTALVVLTCNGKRYEINLSSDESKNGAVKLLFKH